MKNSIKIAILFTLILSACVLMLSACGNKEPEVHVHAFGEWEAVTPLTCLTDGSYVRFCACGETQTKEQAASGHSFGEWVTLREATCSNAGKQERYCACGETETQMVTVEHTWTEASCLTPQTCLDCLKTEGQALEHFFVSGVCARCGMEPKVDLILPRLPIQELKVYAEDGEEIIARLSVTDITYEVTDSGHLLVRVIGVKTYGENEAGVAFEYHWEGADGSQMFKGAFHSSYFRVGDIFNTVVLMEDFAAQNAGETCTFVLEDYKRD